MWLYLLHDVEGEGADLLDGVDGNLVLKASVLPLLQQIVVHLAGAEKDLLNGGWVLAGGTIVQDHPLELGTREQVVKGRLALWQSEQRLGSHHDQGFPERQLDLPPEHVGVVGGVGAVGHNHVDGAELLHGKLFILRWEIFRVIAAQLEEPLWPVTGKKSYFHISRFYQRGPHLHGHQCRIKMLDAVGNFYTPGRTVFRAHSLHSVGQQHHETRLPHPLRLAARDELVNDALGSVGKVSELTLPQNQGIWVGHGIAKLKAKDAIFGERAVADRVGRLVRVQVGQRVVGRPGQQKTH